MTPLMWMRCAIKRNPARPVVIRTRKSSFTIRVDQMFTVSRQRAFTTHAIAP
jgi:hypothetical protein